MKAEPMDPEARLLTNLVCCKTVRYKHVYYVTSESRPPANQTLSNGRVICNSNSSSYIGRFTLEIDETILFCTENNRNKFPKLNFFNFYLTCDKIVFEIVSFI